MSVRALEDLCQLVKEVCGHEEAERCRRAFTQEDKWSCVDALDRGWRELALSAPQAFAGDVESALASTVQPYLLLSSMFALCSRLGLEELALTDEELTIIESGCEWLCERTGLRVISNAGSLWSFDEKCLPLRALKDVEPTAAWSFSGYAPMYGQLFFDRRFVEDLRASEIGPWMCAWLVVHELLHSVVETEVMKRTTAPIRSASVLAYTLEETAVSLSAYAALQVMMYEREPSVEESCQWMRQYFAESGVAAKYLLECLADEDESLGSAVKKALKLAVAAQMADSEGEVVELLEEASGRKLWIWRWMQHLTTLPGSCPRPAATAA
jgi:hypothetical protein